MLVVAASVAIAIFLRLAWYTMQVLLLVFAGLLLAIFLRGLSAWVSDYSPLTGNWALSVVIVLLLAALSVGVWLLMPRITDQIDQLIETLPDSLRHLEHRIRQSGVGRWFYRASSDLDETNAGGSLFNLERVQRIFSTTFGAIGSLILVLFIGLYMSVNPGLYVKGLLRLVPINKRQRAGEILGAVRDTLWWWLIGTCVSMAAVGIMSALGLWLLGVPLALTFGLIAGLLAFVPFLGPIISAIPPTLIAMTQSPILALYVVLLYLGVQSIESYLITPLVQQRTAFLPPVLTLLAQVLLGVLSGIIGILVATPLIAATLVLVKMLYVEDVLGDAD
jgi:predicted PurR-regulated permease PerM